MILSSSSLSSPLSSSSCNLHHRLGSSENISQSSHVGEDSGGGGWGGGGGVQPPGFNPLPPANFFLPPTPASFFSFFFGYPRPKCRFLHPPTHPPTPSHDGIVPLILIFWDVDEKHFTYAGFDHFSILISFYQLCWSYVFLFVVWDLLGKELTHICLCVWWQWIKKTVAPLVW